MSELLERETQLSKLEQLLQRAHAGEGSLVVVEGPPGIGKTTLVREAARQAADAGFTTYRAAGAPLERPFAWGVARQLFERPLRRLGDDARAAVLEGVATLAEDVLLSLPEARSPAASAATDPLASLHALYWLCANLAERQPLALIVDDAHWADEQSLRFLAHLAPRVGELALLVVLSTRPPERGSAVLRTLARDPDAERMQLAPLSADSVAALLADGDSAADAAFVAACYEATGGNPFLATTLAGAVRDTGIAPHADQADSARELGSRALSEIVVHRMLSLSPEVAQLARAIAVLAPRAELALAAELCGLQPDAASAAADALAAEGLLGADRPLRFVHPLMQSAITDATPPSQRARLHARAAELLAREQAPPEEVAGHWLLAEPAGRPDAVSALHAAAQLSSARGAPDAALRYLQRALAEPPAAEVRSELLGELGAVELALGLEVGERRLRQAMAAASDPVTHARLARQLAVPFFGLARFQEAAELFAAGRHGLNGADPELELTLRADESNAVRFARAEPTDLSDAAGLSGTTAGERALLSAAAFGRALDGGSAEEVAALAQRAARDGLIAREPAEYMHLATLIYSLIVAGRYDDSLSLLDTALERAAESSLRTATITLSWMRGLLHARLGRLAEAEAEAERSVLEGTGANVVMDIPRSVLIEIQLDRGRTGAARATLDARGDDALPRGWGENWLRFARARLSLSEGDAAAAREDLEQLLATDSGWRAGNPACCPLRSTLALALLATGEPEAALAHAEEELALARDWGTAAAIGVAQRVIGLCRGGSEGLAALEQSAATLADAPERLERARTLVELGAALRRAGRRTDAQQPLRLGLDLADRCGAQGLAETTREELRAAGVRPRRAALGGVEALTPSELRVARLAAAGRTNREIAQALFVTRSTVEAHLTHVYQKLSISSRRELQDLIDQDPDA